MRTDRKKEEINEGTLREVQTAQSKGCQKQTWPSNHILYWNILIGNNALLIFHKQGMGWAHYGSISVTLIEVNNCKVFE